MLLGWRARYAIAACFSILRLVSVDEMGVSMPFFLSSPGSYPDSAPSPPPITPHPTPIKRPIVLQPELAPVVRQLVIRPKPLPPQPVVPRAFARVAQPQHHPVRVLGHHALRLDVHVAFGLRLLACRRVFDGGTGPAETPAAAQGVFHHAAGE